MAGMITVMASYSRWRYCPESNMPPKQGCRPEAGERLSAMPQARATATAIEDGSPGRT